MLVTSKPQTRWDYTVTIDEDDVDDFINQLRSLLEPHEGEYGFGRVREFYFQLMRQRDKDTKPEYDFRK